jgi:hypothetical protein
MSSSNGFNDAMVRDEYAGTASVAGQQAGEATTVFNGAEA